MEYAPWMESSFRERMDEARDTAVIEACSRSRVTRVTWAVKMRPKPVEWWTAEYLAAELGVSVARVKLLCGQGRIPGAKRPRKGRGSPWAIPANWNGHRHVVTVTPGSRGPKLKTSKVLSPSESEVPF